MNYPMKEPVQQIHASPRTADEERLASDLLAWREIAEKLEETSDHRYDCEVHQGISHPCTCGYKEACAAYEKAVKS